MRSLKKAWRAGIRQFLRLKRVGAKQPRVNGARPGELLRHPAVPGG